jgi:hypothetical protein
MKDYGCKTRRQQFPLLNKSIIIRSNRHGMAYYELFQTEVRKRDNVAIIMYLKMWMHPCPFVRKKKLLCLFHEISFTSKLNCSSALILCVRVSMKVTRSSLFPTAIVFPSGDHVILIFSPGEEKCMIQTAFTLNFYHIGNLGLGFPIAIVLGARFQRGNYDKAISVTGRASL